MSSVERFYNLVSPVAGSCKPRKPISRCSWLTHWKATGTTSLFRANMAPWPRIPRSLSQTKASDPVCLAAYQEDIQLLYLYDWLAQHFKQRCLREYWHAPTTLKLCLYQGVVCFCHYLVGSVCLVWYCVRSYWKPCVFTRVVGVNVVNDKSRT